MRRLSRTWPLGIILRQPRVERVVSVFLRSGTVRERTRFVLRELPQRRMLARYAIRRSGLPIFVRHGTPDIATLDEVFYQDSYALPAAVETKLRDLAGPPRILDLGANIGLFGVFVLGAFPGAQGTAIEADPANAAVLRRCAEANSGRGEWEIVEAAASNRDGEVAFAAGGYSLSHAAGPDEPGTPVRAVDVLPYLAAADLARLERAKARIVQDRPLAAFDVNLGEVSVCEQRQDIDRLHLGCGLPCFGGTRGREAPENKGSASLAGARRAANQIPVGSGVGRDRRFVHRGVLRVDLDRNEAGAREALQHERSEQPDVRAEVDHAQDVDLVERPGELRREVVFRLGEDLVENHHIWAVVPERDGYLGAAQPVAPGRVARPQLVECKPPRRLDERCAQREAES